MKRRPFQLISTLVTNSYFYGMLTGPVIYGGAVKYLCVRRLNC